MSRESEWVLRLSENSTNECVRDIKRKNREVVKNERKGCSHTKFKRVMKELQALRRSHPSDSMVKTIFF